MYLLKSAGSSPDKGRILVETALRIAEGYRSLKDGHIYAHLDVQTRVGTLAVSLKYRGTAA